MAIMTIEIPDALLMKALAAAAAKGISFEAHVEEVLLVADDEVDEAGGLTDLETALEMAVERAKKLPPGKEFQLQDLFSDAEWASVASPTWFGRKFRPAVEQAGIAKFKGKTQANKAVYLRS